MRTAAILVAVLGLFVASSVTGCRDRRPKPLGNVVEVVYPAAAYLAPYRCRKGEFALRIRSETTQMDPTSGQEITVGNEHYQCVDKSTAEHYEVGDQYP